MHTTLFGTDGIRTTMGQEPLTPKSLVQLGNAIGYWMTQQNKKQLVLAHDTRLSCSLVKSALKTGLLQHSLTVTDACVLPTPALFNTVKESAFDVGIMITASHNQYHDNGLKIFTKEYGKTTKQQEQKISDFFHTVQSVTSYESLGNTIVDTNISKNYQDKIRKLFPKKFLQNSTIVLDCAHGAFSLLAPDILRSFGANVILLSNEPTGKNINFKCGSQYPQALQQSVVTHKANIGFAFDGDGDRVIMVDKHGTIYNGDHILALLLQNPTYQDQHHIVSTIMANQGLETYTIKHNKKMLRTSVGDKNVLKQMQEENCLLGGEPSGHIILRDFNETSDGLFTTLRILETVLLNKTWDIQTFKNYPQVLINVPVALKKDLSLSPYTHIIKKHQKNLTDGRLVVRYSGTEPLLRVMIEDTSQEHAQTVGNLLSQELIQTLAQEVE